MNALLQWSEALFASIPLPLMDAWGRFGYAVGLVLMVLAYGGFIFKPGGKWGLGIERQSWGPRALISMPVTFVLVFGSGYLGSSIVLVPGAQTFESLKDVSVFACILTFGYPALLIVPFAYGLSDMVEGVPPDFILDWIFGYFINPACFWIAYQFIGRDPDFRRSRTWAWYFAFVFIFLFIEPQLWGYICSGKFSPEIAYRNITPALFFTTGLTWLAAPFAMLAFFPLAKKFGMFWADIPGNVRQTEFHYKTWKWTRVESPSDTSTPWNRLPIRIFIAAPFILLVLIMIGATAYVTLQSSEASAKKLANRLQAEISGNIRSRLDDFVSAAGTEKLAATELHALLQRATNQPGRAFILDRSGNLISSSFDEEAMVNSAADLVVPAAMKHYLTVVPDALQIRTNVESRFDVITARPLSHETWLLFASPYREKGARVDWIVVSCMPSSVYLEGVHAAQSRSGVLISIALVASLLIAAVLASILTSPIRRIAQATHAMAKGNLQERTPRSRLEELDLLSTSLNDMAEQIALAFRQTKESDDRFRELAAHIEDVLWITTPHNATVIYASPAYEKVFGVSVETLYADARSRLKIVHPDDLPGVQAAADRMGDGPYAQEYRIIRPDGNVRWIHARGFPVVDASGVVTRIVGVARDVTVERKLGTELVTAMESLRKLNRFYEVLSRINHTIVRKHDVQKLFDEVCRIAVKDGNFRIAWVGRLNPDTQKVEVVSSAGNTADYLSTIDIDLSDPALGEGPTGRAVKTGQHMISNDNKDDPSMRPWLDRLHSLGIRASAAFPIWVFGKIWGAITLYSAEPGFFNADEIKLLDELAMDIAFAIEFHLKEEARHRTETALKASEERLFQSQKLEGLGTLASGIAHDFNNILGIIRAHTTIIETETSGLEKAQKGIKAISTATARGIDLVKQLLLFARKSERRVEAVQVDDLIQEAAAMLHSIFPKTITIETALDPGIPKVQGDAAQIHQVIVNLCVNARDAMPEGGRIRISTRTASSAEVRAAGMESLPGAIVMSVSDTGLGMDEGTRQRIFEPFFSTKERGKGTGLGLSLVVGIMESHGGRVLVDTEIGKGTKFECFFPVDQHPLNMQATDENTGAANQPRSGTILLVEDEDLMLDAVKHLLEAYGYSVLTARDGEEGARVYEDHHKVVSVVVSDLGLPKLSGESMYRRLVQTNPDARVIFASGFIDPGLRTRLQSDGKIAFIQKPYEISELIGALDEILERS